MDKDAIARNLSYIAKQLSELAAEIAKGDDEYSPLMSWDRFHAEFDEAIAKYGLPIEDACLCAKLGMTGKHRCSSREHLVKCHMDSKGKARAG